MPLEDTKSHLQFVFLPPSGQSSNRQLYWAVMRGKLKYPILRSNFRKKATDPLTYLLFDEGVKGGCCKLASINMVKYLRVVVIKPDP